jgi:hypothetical protein
MRVLLAIVLSLFTVTAAQARCTDADVRNGIFAGAAIGAVVGFFGTARHLSNLPVGGPGVATGATVRSYFGSIWSQPVVTRTTIPVVTAGTAIVSAGGMYLGGITNCAINEFVFAEDFTWSDLGRIINPWN